MVVKLERTNDPIEAFEWAFDLDGPGGPAAFLLAPSRFAFAERTSDSLALTLHDERWFGAAFGPNPPLRPEWQTCFLSYSSQGERVGELVRRDEWDFYTRAVERHEYGAPVDEVTDTSALTDLLNSHAPHSMVWPGDPEIDAWYGVGDESGLASIAALVRWESGFHVISSVATRTDARGRGLARHVVTGVVLAASARGLSWLGLGVAHDNAVAKRLYERVGFTCRAEFAVYRSREASTAPF